MRKGFTILELLVASLLLGMLVTILTMIFNQSSIAWRVGDSVIVGMDKVRDTIASVREDADNVFVSDNNTYRLLGLWQANGNPRKRACDTSDSGVDSTEGATWFKGKVSLNDNSKLGDIAKTVDVGSLDKDASFQNYTVNVKSNGPNGKPDDWDDIWSFPDEFD